MLTEIEKSKHRLEPKKRVWNENLLRKSKESYSVCCN